MMNQGTPFFVKVFLGNQSKLLDPKEHLGCTAMWRALTPEREDGKVDKLTRAK